MHVLFEYINDNLSTLLSSHAKKQTKMNRASPTSMCFRLVVDPQSSVPTGVT